MFPLGVVGGLQEITSVELSGEFACKSVTGPDTGIKVIKLILPLLLFTNTFTWIRN